MADPLFTMIAVAPTPVAPFSHAVEADGMVFITEQMPTWPDDDSRSSTTPNHIRIVRR